MVGVVNTLIGLSSIFIMMHLLGINYWGSTFTGNTLGAIFSYFLNRSFTFQSKASISTSSVQFVIVIVSCYMFSYYTGDLIARHIHQAIELITLDKRDLAVFIGTGIYTITNYVGQKLIVFRKL
ncbi:GtrA family protein [Cytobacillus luteolus]|uniref:GtrA family protein n=1 Tax=Litchfieldia luteola TaxID=682179 RepID=UPI0029CA8B8C|nr:GtrA family protein [Cytobacillus luteolus]